MLIYRHWVIMDYSITHVLRGQFLTKLIGYRESIVLIIHTKNASNLTIRYQDMVPVVQNVWMVIKTDDAKTISLQHNTPDHFLSAVNDAFTSDMTLQYYTSKRSQRIYLSLFNRYHKNNSLGSKQ